jgi:hypothetical protein
MHWNFAKWKVFFVDAFKFFEISRGGEGHLARI